MSGTLSESSRFCSGFRKAKAGAFVCDALSLRESRLASGRKLRRCRRGLQDRPHTSRELPENSCVIANPRLDHRADQICVQFARLHPRLVYLDLSICVRLAQRTFEIAAVAFHQLSCLCAQKVVVLDHLRTKRYERTPHYLAHRSSALELAPINVIKIVDDTLNRRNRSFAEYSFKVRMNRFPIGFQSRCRHLRFRSEKVVKAAFLDLSP